MLGQLIVDIGGWLARCRLCGPRTRQRLRQLARAAKSQRGIFRQGPLHYRLNRRHQIKTQCWYNAYPGLTAFDLARNTRVRTGLQRRWMTKRHIRAWLRDL